MESAPARKRRRRQRPPPHKAPPPSQIADCNWKQLLEKSPALLPGKRRTKGRQEKKRARAGEEHHHDHHHDRNRGGGDAGDSPGAAATAAAPKAPRRALRRLDDAVNGEIIRQAQSLHRSQYKKKHFRAILDRFRARGQLADQIAALDCEMVGVGKRRLSELARVTIVDGAGAVLIDSFVRPTHPVTDYRTWVSGIRKQDLRGAPSLSEVRHKVLDLLRPRQIVVGHSIENDLKALKLQHLFPQNRVRDTATFPPLTRLDGRPRALRELVAEHAGLEIQTGQHSSLDDARATLYLYLLNMVVWEKHIEEGEGEEEEEGEDNAERRGGQG